MSETEPVVLTRTYQMPVTFNGTLLAVVDSVPPEPLPGKWDNRRWHELALYRHDDGRLVMAIGFRTKSQDEVERDTVIVADTLESLRERTSDYDPCEWLVGFPTIWPDNPRREASFQQKQEWLENRVNDDFDQRLALLLADAGFAEEL